MSPPEKSCPQSEPTPDPTLPSPVPPTGPNSEPKLVPGSEAGDLPPPRRPRAETPRRAPLQRRPAPVVPLPKRLDRKRADDVLSTWIALEALSPPHTYRKP